MGIELNAEVLKYVHPSMHEAWAALGEKRFSYCIDYEKVLWFFGIAKRAGCKFYAGSDAHSHERLDGPKNYLPELVKDLGLDEKDKFVPEKERQERRE